MRLTLQRVVALGSAAIILASGCGGGSASSESSGTSVSTEVSATASAGGATTSAVPTPTVSDPVALGKQAFLDNGCGNCNVVAAAGSSGKGAGGITLRTGPNLDETLAADARNAGQPLPLFTYESIVDTNAFIAPGWKSGVMYQGYSTVLSREEIAEIVAFLVESIEQ